jgi:hypothetical protein
MASLYSNGQLFLKDCGRGSVVRVDVGGRGIHPSTDQLRVPISQRLKVLIFGIATLTYVLKVCQTTCKND